MVYSFTACAKTENTLSNTNESFFAEDSTSAEEKSEEVPIQQNAKSTETTVGSSEVAKDAQLIKETEPTKSSESTQSSEASKSSQSSITTETSKSTTSSASSQTPSSQKSNEKTTTPSSTQVSTCKWVETARSSTTNCFEGITKTTINYKCSDCGKTKNEVTEATSVCDWQLVDLNPNITCNGCFIQYFKHNTCVIHGTQAGGMPVYEEIDTHDYQGIRTEPTCSHQGYIDYKCVKCGKFWKNTEIIPELPHTWTSSFTDDQFVDDAWYTITFEACSVCGARNWSGEISRKLCD